MTAARTLPAKAGETPVAAPQHTDGGASAPGKSPQGKPVIPVPAKPVPRSTSVVASKPGAKSVTGKPKPRAPGTAAKPHSTWRDRFLSSGFAFLKSSFPRIFGNQFAESTLRAGGGAEMVKQNQRISFKAITAKEAREEMSVDSDDHMVITLNAAEQTRAVMALLSNGLLVVAKGYESDRSVQSCIALAGHKGIQILRKVSVEIDVIKEYRERKRTAAAPKEVEDNEIRKEILAIIREAVSIGASDIHVAVDSRKGSIEIRSDGVLRAKDREIPSEHGKRFCAAVYPMCEASDASYDESKPQSGRITGGQRRLSAAGGSFELPAGLQALRVQWNPTSYGGRYMILRLLYAAKSDNGNLAGLGFAPEQMEVIERAVDRPVGMVYISGPTGSGKSTTLQRAMRWLITKSNGELNVITIEDPPEYVILGAKQVPVTNANTEAERKQAFTGAISAAMRSDPDVIMIGEVRDAESARLACQAGLTGHRVFTTLHVNDAISIPDRLRDIGVEEYKIYDPSLVSALVGQRLARLLCMNCRIPLVRAIREESCDPTILDRLRTALPGVAEDEIAASVHVAGPGCSICTRRAGYGERSVLAEVIGPDARLMEILRSGRKLDAWRYWVTDRGGITMIGHGLSKVLAGIMSPFEVERVVGPIDGDQHLLASLAAADAAALRDARAIPSPRTAD